MLPRTQVFVDTSYLLASFYNSWETGARAQLEIDLPEVVGVLGRMIQEQLGQPIHRQLWYDGLPDSGPHRYQRALRTCNGVLLRAGQLIEWGERRTQKAVDTRLVADMVLAGVRGTCSDIVLVSGDADMIPGVQEASMAGVRVHLYGFGWDSMSSALRHACDSTTILDPREDFADCMQLQVLEGPLPPQVRPKPIGDAEPLDDVSPCAVPDPSSPRGHEAATGGSAQDTAETHSGSDETVGSTHSAPRSSRPGEPVETDDDRPYSARPSAQARSGNETSGDNDTARSSQTQRTATVEPPATLATPNAAAPLTPAHLAGDTPEPAPQPTPADIAATANHQREQSRAQDTVDERTGQDAETARLSEEESAVARAQIPEHATRKSAEKASAVTDQEDSAVEQKLREPTAKPKPKPAPKPSMMAPRRKLRSRYVPLPNEVWASAGFQTPFDVGQQYASWWYDNAASTEQRDQAHMLSGGGLPPEIDRPLLQFACETLHEYTLTESQRVSLRDGFHSGIRGVLINLSNRH